MRAATVCGLSPRLRLDLTINILSYHGIFNNKIRVFGGSQMRPNVHIQDLVEFYMFLLEAPAEKVNGKAFNVSNENASVMELAQMIQGQLEGDVPIEIVPTEDIRSYHLSAQKAKQELGFECQRPLTLAVDELKQAVSSGELKDPELSKYHNIRQMKENPTFMEWD